MSRLFRACLALALIASAPAAPAEGERELTVFAAASLREAFAELGRIFEREHPGTKVTFSLAGSQELRTQIEHGAPADVFASADWKHMQALVAAKLASGPRRFARNEPVLAVPKDNPAGLRSLADLPRAQRIVVGAPEVPIGAYTLRIFEAASKRYGAGFGTAVEAHVVSREPNVRQVLSKVALGEADAAIVYRTDAKAFKGGVEVISLPEELNVVAEYPVAVLERAKEAELAGEFVDLLLSPAGQETLGRFGFRPGTGG
jgi:molybdate transport system substrate-binding protein